MGKKRELDYYIASIFQAKRNIFKLEENQNTTWKLSFSLSKLKLNIIYTPGTSFKIWKSIDFVLEIQNFKVSYFHTQNFIHLIQSISFTQECKLVGNVHITTSMESKFLDFQLCSGSVHHGASFTYFKWTNLKVD